VPQRLYRGHDLRVSVIDDFRLLPRGLDLRVEKLVRQQCFPDTGQRRPDEAVDVLEVNAARELAAPGLDQPLRGLQQWLDKPDLATPDTAQQVAELCLRGAELIGGRRKLEFG